VAAYEDFEKLDVRVGCIVSVEEFPEARKLSYKLVIDFGPQVGTRKSCGQFVENYAKEELKGTLVACVINFPRRQIGPTVSEVLTLGFPDRNGNAVLVSPTKGVPLGGRLF
jgi:tRNA-binding protein